MKEISKYKFFMRWSKNHSHIKFIGKKWRKKKKIVFQNEYSFLSWEIDPVSGSGIKTSSFDEKDEEALQEIYNIQKGIKGKQNRLAKQIVNVGDFWKNGIKNYPGEFGLLESSMAKVDLDN